MKDKKRFYQISTGTNRIADINIYGDITSWEWFDSDVSAHSLKSEIDELDVDEINVYIDSYGGEVSEALAIYTALKRHPATVNTYCDGFACSAASIVFCAGQKRVMGKIALLMIHDCRSHLGYATSKQMRKSADDNDIINSSSIKAYMSVVNISEDEIKAMMDAETWLDAEKCIEYGFATEIADDNNDDEQTVQSAFGDIRTAILDKSKATTAAEGNELRNIMQKLDEIIEAVESKSPQDPKPKELVINQKAINFLNKLTNKEV